MPFLVVDSNSADRTALVAILKWSDNRIAVYQAASIAEACLIIVEKRPSVIFCAFPIVDAENLWNLLRDSSKIQIVCYGVELAPASVSDLFLSKPASRLKLLQVLGKIKKRRSRARTSRTLETPEWKKRHHKPTKSGDLEITVRFHEEPLKFTMHVHKGACVADALKQIGRQHVIDFSLASGEPVRPDTELGPGDELILKIQETGN